MGADSTRYPGLYWKCRKAYNELLEPLRAIAKEHGYALAVHGSIARDIDLIAVAWIEKPWPVPDLVEALRYACEKITGFAKSQEGDPVKKPHGRESWVIILGGGIYIDLAIIPPAATVE